MSKHPQGEPQKRKVRRNTIILVCVAVAVYASFILAGVVRSGAAG
ncbi:MAG: hypothetical protein AAFO81_01685 [Pseudomonadota bacterium]